MFGIFCKIPINKTNQKWSKISYDITYMCDLKNDTHKNKQMTMNLFTKEK